MVYMDKQGTFRMCGKYGSFRRFVTWGEIKQIDAAGGYRGHFEVIVPSFWVEEAYGQRDGSITQHGSSFDFLKVKDASWEHLQFICYQYGWSDDKIREVFFAD